MRVGVVGLGMLALVAATSAKAADPCDGTKWPLSRELAWFQTAKPVKSGAIMLPGHAAVVELQPMQRVDYAVPLNIGWKTANTFGAVITTATTPGVYQVTISDSAYVGVAQNGKIVTAMAMQTLKGCPGLNRSVRFRLGQGPAAIQIGGAKGDRLLVAIAPED